MSTGVIFILGKGVTPILAYGVKSTWPQGSSAPGFSSDGHKPIVATQQPDVDRTQTNEGANNEGQNMSSPPPVSDNGQPNRGSAKRYLPIDCPISVRLTGTNLKLRPALSPSLTVTTNPHCPVSTCSKSVPVTTRRKRHSIAPCSAERKRSDAGLNYSINIEIQNPQWNLCYRYRSPRRPPQHNCQERPPPV